MALFSSVYYIKSFLYYLNVLHNKTFISLAPSFGVFILVRSTPLIQDEHLSIKSGTISMLEIISLAKTFVLELTHYYIYDILNSLNRVLKTIT